MSNHNEKEKPADVAVFFDYENIVFSVRNNYNINANFEDLMDKCKEFGRVVVARAFADWNRQSSAMIPVLISNGFDPVYVPSFQMGDGQIRKNAVDMYMAIDAMDILHNRKNVDTFILLTGDSDFLPLVNAVRREGNRVIAIGVDGSASSHLAQSVDEFIFYSQVSALPDVNPKRPKDIYEALVQAIKNLESDGKSTVLPNVKLVMGELLGGFDEKKHNDSKGRRFQKFKEFVQEGQRRGLVRLVTTGTVNEVFLANDNKQRDTQKNGSQHQKKDERKEPETPTQPNLEDAYKLLARSVESAIKDDRSLHPSVIKNVMVDMYTGFNEKEIVVNGDKPFSRFGDFIDAAEKEGYIVQSGKGPRKELHLPNEEADETEEAVKEVEEIPAEESAVEEQQPEPAAEEESEIPVDALIPTVPSSEEDAGSELDNKQLIVDSLRSFRAYPAPFLKIEAHCRQVRNERRLYLPSPKVRELLTEATRSVGLLKRVSPPGVSPAQYEFQNEEKRIAEFLGVPLQEVAEEASTPEAAEKDTKPAAESKEESISPDLQKGFDLLLEAVKVAESSKRSLRLGAIAKRMRGIDSSFDEKQIQTAEGESFKRFADFVKAAEEAGIVKLSGEGAATQIHSKKSK